MRRETRDEEHGEQSETEVTRGNGVNWRLTARSLLSLIPLTRFHLSSVRHSSLIPSVPEVEP